MIPHLLLKFTYAKHLMVVVVVVNDGKLGTFLNTPVFVSFDKIIMTAVNEYINFLNHEIWHIEEWFSVLLNMKCVTHLQKEKCVMLICSNVRWHSISSRSAVYTQV